MTDRNILAGLACVLLLHGLASAQEPRSDEDPPEVLRRKLNAQQAVNEQLRQRLETLERRLANSRETDAPLIAGLDPRAPSPVEEPGISKAVSAIEEALGEKGLVLLPAGAYRLTPSATWAHSGSGPDRRDSYVLGMALEAGLPGGMALSVRQPYIWRDYGYGTNSGAGDFSMALAKKLNSETETMPSFVARMEYTHDNGKDPFKSPSIGSGFRSFDIGLSGVKRLDPLVFYGNISYSRAQEAFASIQVRDNPPQFTGRIKPGDVYGLGFGVSLAATPDVALDTGLTLAFAEQPRFRDVSGNTEYGTRRTVGYLNLGTRVLLTRNLFLSVSAAAGVTKDASDLVLSFALPYRF